MASMDCAHATECPTMLCAVLSVRVNALLEGRGFEQEVKYLKVAT